MGHVVVEDASGCVDREALETEERSVLGDAILAAYEIRAQVTDRGSALALDVSIGCDPGSAWCGRHAQAGAGWPARLQTAEILHAECAQAHDLVLTQADNYLRALFSSGQMP